jgi:hypothetical protein
VRVLRRRAIPLCRHAIASPEATPPGSAASDSAAQVKPQSLCVPQGDVHPFILRSVHGRCEISQHDGRMHVQWLSSLVTTNCISAFPSCAADFLLLLFTLSFAGDLLSILYCLFSTVYSLLSILYCLFSTVYSLLSILYCLFSTVYSLLSILYCLWHHGRLVDCST